MGTSALFVGPLNGNGAAMPRGGGGEVPVNTSTHKRMFAKPTFRGRLGMIYGDGLSGGRPAPQFCASSLRTLLVTMGWVSFSYLDEILPKQD